MSDQVEQGTVTLSLSTDEFGVLLGCVSSAEERSTDPDRRSTFIDLADKLREAQRDMLGPMSVAEGMGVVTAIRDTERDTVAFLREQ